MVYFIVNPHAGNKSNRYHNQIINYLEKIPNSRILETEYAGHAQSLINSVINKAPERIIAIGGDGTINEIGQVLKGSGIPMGIIPMGSGNGLARHLGIPMHFKKALRIALTGQPIEIDVLNWNEKTFFCTAGVGFDAVVAKKFATLKGRGLINYIRATLTSIFKYKSIQVQIENEPTEFVFSLTFANANQFGNNAYISPNSNLQDALFEVIKVKKGPILQICQLGISLFLKRIHSHALVRISSCNSLHIRIPDGTPFHLDGESLISNESNIHIRLDEKKLKIISN